MSATRWQTILVVISKPFERDQPALSKAAAIARRCRARLVLFNSFMVPQPVNGFPLGSRTQMGSRTQILDAASRERREHLRTLARKARVLNAKYVVHWDYPAHEAIVRQVLAHQADLLITDSHRHGRLARLLLANTDWELMRTCPCPMWFVRSPALTRAPSVLVAVDPRHTHAKPARLDDRLLQTAATLTGQLGGKTTVIHACQTAPDVPLGLLMRPLIKPPQSPATREFIERTTASVVKLGAKYGIAAANCIVREGVTREVIASATRRSAVDVLVMGAVSRTPAAQPVIGSTAEVLIDQVTCDVLVVKPAGFRTPVKRRAAKT